MSLPPFPNAELVALDGLEVLAAGRWECGGRTPAALAEHVPFVRVRRAGGPSDNVNDYPFLVVEVYADTYEGAIDIAEEIRAFLLAGHVRSGNGQIDRTLCTSAHTELPSPDPELRLISTTYRATCRRLTTAV